MNKQAALREEEESYERAIRKIGFANKIAKKVDLLLPKGWASTYENLFGELKFSNYDSMVKDSTKKPSEEFKLICKILIKMGGHENLREADAKSSTNEITALRATYSLDMKDGGSLSVEVVQYHPDHKCEIKWETRTYQAAIVSDACLGLGGK